MQDDWEDKTVVATSLAPAAAAGGKRAQLVVMAGVNVGEMYNLQGTLVICRGRETSHTRRSLAPSIVSLPRWASKRTLETRSWSNKIHDLGMNMIRSSAAKWIIGLVIFIAILGLLRFKPWQRGNNEAARQQLSVGFLPVT